MIFVINNFPFTRCIFEILKKTYVIEATTLYYDGIAQI